MEMDSLTKVKHEINNILMFQDMIKFTTCKKR